MTKKSRQKFKHIETEMSFYDKIKSIFHHFQIVFIEANRKNLLWKVGVQL